MGLERDIGGEEESVAGDWRTMSGSCWRETESAGVDSCSRLVERCSTPTPASSLC